MLTGEVYDFNRNPQGEYFTYSGKYADKGGGRADNRARTPKAMNPTGSPDLFGQFAATFKMLHRNKPGILKKYYRYPYAVATPHLYMPPVDFKTMESLLDPDGRSSRKEPQGTGSSDFINAEPEVSKGTAGKEYRSAPSLIAVFKGSIVAPKSMKFRFYGAADEGMLVKFNGRMVLETGYVFSELYAGNGEKDKGCGWYSMNEYHQQVAEDKIPSKKNYVIQKHSLLQQQVQGNGWRSPHIRHQRRVVFHRNHPRQCRGTSSLLPPYAGSNARQQSPAQTIQN